MGEVRAGRDLRLDRDVAVKLLGAEVARKRNSRDRFEAEPERRRASAATNIVLVYDSGKHLAPFLDMERLPGRTLPTSGRGCRCAAY